MCEYFYESPMIESVIWTTIPMVVNVLMYLFIQARALRIFKKTKSENSALNSLRRMNSYLGVPLCILTTVLYFIIMFYFLQRFNNYEFINKNLTMLSIIIAVGLGLLSLFMKNICIGFTALKIAPIKNVKFYFNLNNLSPYFSIYGLTTILIVGAGIIENLTPNKHLLHIIFIVVYYITIFVLAKVISKKLSKKQQQPMDMEPGELKTELLEMAASIKRKKLSIVVVPQDESLFGPAAGVYAIKHGTVFLSDTLLNTLTKGEIKAIMAHELAHLKYKHVGKRFFACILGIALAVFLYEWLYIYKYWYEPETYYLIITGFCFFYFGILMKYLLRKQEYQADAFTLKMGIPYEDFKEGLVKIIDSYEVSFERSPIEEIFSTHPLLKNRLKRLEELSHSD